MFCHTGLMVNFLLAITLNSVALADVSHLLQKGKELNSTAGELLLELMIKIASNPYQWSRMHNLLANINSSISSPKRISLNNIKRGPDLQSVSKDSYITSFEESEEVVTNRSSPLYHSWLGTQPEKYKNSHLKPYYKTFVYHKVLGSPTYFNRNPKAYVAVSIIAPKYITSRTSEDLFLEKELRQLKPWTHQQNLKNMASIRSRWIIRADKKI